MDTTKTPDPGVAALDECERLFDHFEDHAKRHKRSFLRYKYTSVGLTVGVTVIAALQALYPPLSYWMWVLPVVSGLSAFFTAMIYATNSQELWLRARSMTQRLDKERFLFKQNAGTYAAGKGDAVELFSTRLMDIWTAGHGEWEHAVKQQGVA